MRLRPPLTKSIITNKRYTSNKRRLLNKKALSLNYIHQFTVIYTKHQMKMINTLHTVHIHMCCTHVYLYTCTVLTYSCTMYILYTYTCTVHIYSCIHVLYTYTFTCTQQFSLQNIAAYMIRKVLSFF